MEQIPMVRLSQIDQDRFGFPVAKTNVVKADSIDSIIDYCKENNVKLCMARCSGEHLETAQMLERAGFLLMGDVLTYKLDLKKFDTNLLQSKYPARKLKKEEISQVVEIAEAAFKKYVGHYHMDPRLDPRLCDKVYVDWALRSCSNKNVADEVLVVELGQTLAGFGVLKINEKIEGVGVLYGVSPEFRRRGVFNSLLTGSILWFKALGVNEMIYETQLINYPPQRVITRYGFVLQKAEYVFHKWLE